MPVLFEISVTFPPEAAAVVMAEPALERLVAGPVQLAPITREKCTASIGVFLQSDFSLTALERGRQHSKGQLRGDFNHHAILITRVYRAACLFHGPPPGPPAIISTDLTGARRGWGILRFEAPLPSFHRRHALPGGLQRSSGSPCRL